LADLIDRIRGKRDLGRPKIPAAQFFGSYVLVATGDMTRAEAKDDYDLQGEELTQADALLDKLESKATTIAKIVYTLKILSVSALLERGETEDSIYNNPDGTINKTRVKADLEL